MIEWFFATLRQYHGDRDLPLARPRVLLWCLHLQGHRPGVGDRHACSPRSSSGRSASRSHNPSRRPSSSCSCSRSGTASGRAVRPRRRQDGLPRGDLLGGPVRVQPAGPRRDRQFVLLSIHDGGMAIQSGFRHRSFDLKPILKLGDSRAGLSSCTQKASRFHSSDELLRFIASVLTRSPQHRAIVVTWLPHDRQRNVTAH